MHAADGDTSCSREQLRVQVVFGSRRRSQVVAAGVWAGCGLSLENMVITGCRPTNGLAADGLS